MPRDSRIGDMGVGICVCHVPPIPMIGFLITGAGTELSEDPPPSRIGDVILAICGHTGIMIQGSPDTIVENSPTSRVGDAFTGCFIGVLVTGAPHVLINEYGVTDDILTLA